ncbi:MAG TPA: hypothetical protein GX702_08790 [Chloroflexi bacterium]|jgi:spoIIIJ-associated protein|nr:hypothetical protein [Chloroflexota bacterium]
MENRGKEPKRSVEYTGKSVEDALEQAAHELQVPVDALEYDVIRDSSRTILGLVRTGEAVIRVWLPMEPKPAVPAHDIAAEQPEQPSVEATASRGAEAVEAETEEEEAEAEEPEAPAAGQVDSAQLERVASEVVATLLDKMGILGAVEISDRGGQVDPASGEASPLVLNIVGDDLGGLIGRRGETLRDLQFIVRLIVSRKIGSWPNVVVDVEGYREKRTQALQALAARMADQVRRTGQATVLEPMPAYERRIVHLALRDDPDVYTESTGEDDSRKVQILPK